MADERQVNDVVVYRDSAGFYRERPVDAGGTGSGGGASDTATPSTALAPVHLRDADLASVYSFGTVPAGAKRVVLESNGTAAVRWTDTGDDPSVALGRRITGDRPLDYVGDLTKLKLMGEAPGAALDGTIYG